MSTYEPLGQYLKSNGQDIINLTFAEVERILGFTLPPYLYKYVVGWYGTAEGSPTHREKIVWHSYGYKVKTVELLAQKVVFKRY